MPVKYSGFTAGCEITTYYRVYPANRMAMLLEANRSISLLWREPCRSPSIAVKSQTCSTQRAR